MNYVFTTESQRTQRGIYFFVYRANPFVCPGRDRDKQKDLPCHVVNMVCDCICERHYFGAAAGGGKLPLPRWV